MKPIVQINRPNVELKAVAHSTAFYNPSNPVTIYRLPDGGLVSCELSHGWMEKWFEGDYREETKFWPLSVSQYNEF